MTDFRCAHPNELPEVYTVINQVFRSKYDPTMQFEFPLLFSPDNLRRVFVALDKGKIVSHMGYQKTEYLFEDRRLSVGFLGAVATLPEYRGTGIASRLLEMAEEAMRAGANRSLYLRNGFQELGVTYEYLLTVPEKAPDISLRAYCEKDIDIIHSLYAREEKRFHRDPEAFQRLLGVNHTLRGHGPRSIPVAQIGPTFLVYGQGVPIAYFVLRGNEKYPIEYAGDREGLLLGLKALAKEAGYPQFVWVPESDAQLLSIFERERFRVTNRYFFPPSHTSKALNPTAADPALRLGMPLPGLNYV